MLAFQQLFTFLKRAVPLATITKEMQTKIIKKVIKNAKFVCQGDIKV
jgi:hypothetical protein